MTPTTPDPTPRARTTTSRMLPVEGAPAAGGGGGFVGRDRELAELVAALPHPGDRGARCRLVAGEPGIGKTRLVAELSRHAAAAGVRVVWGYCWDEAGAPPYWPWTQVVRHLRNLTRGVELAPLVLTETEAAEVGPVDRFALFDATAAVLADAARRSPLVVVLDDLHHSDPATLLLARFVLAHLGASPLLLVGTYRPTDLAARPDVAGQLAALVEAQASVETTELTGLDRRAVAELVGDGPPADVVLAVTGGNPLFVQQVVDAARRTAVDGGDPDGPDALRRALTSRIDATSPATRSLVAALAVLGPRASRSAAAALLDVPPGALAAPARAARASDLVVRNGWTVAHPLIAEVALATTSPEELAAMHGIAADLLSAEGGSAAERAHHLCRAGPDHWRAAVAACCEAAETATAALAHEDAVAHYGRALEVLAGRDDAITETFEVTLALAAALERAEGRVPAEDAYQRVMDLARRSGDPMLIARAAARHGVTFYAEQDVLGRRATECRAALDGLPPGASVLRARLLANLAASDIGDPAHRVAADEAVAMARQLGDPETLGIALVAQQVTGLGPATLGRRLRTGREIVALAESCGEPDLAVRGRFLLKAALLEHGDVRELDAQLLAQDKLVNEIAEVRFARHSLWFRCMRAAFDGRAEEVATLAKECLTIAEQLQDPDGYGVYTGQLGVALWMQGRLMELEPVYADLMRSEPYEPLWPAVVGWIRLHDGQPEAARGLLDRLPPPAEIPESMHTLLNLFTMADLTTALGDEASVAEMWEVLLPYADRVVPIAMGAACFGVVARPLGQLALRLGRVEEGLTHLERAVALCARMDARPWLVDAQLALAEALIELGRGDDSRVHRLIGEAGSAVEQLGLAVFEPRVAAVRARHAEFDAPAAATPAGPRHSTEATVAESADSTPRAQVAVLGVFEVVAVDGSVPRWTSRKARTLLKVLVARRGVALSREAAMHLLWPGEPPEALGNRLSVALSTVRRALDPARVLPTNALVRAEGGSIRLDTKRVEVDVETFLALGEGALDAYRRDDPASMEHLETAIEAYRGEALADEPYEPWADALRTEATASYAALLRALAATAMARQDHLRASDAQRRLLEVDPYDEHAHRGLVEALQALGAFGQARAAQERYAAAMSELGLAVTPISDAVSPSPSR